MTAIDVSIETAVRLLTTLAPVCPEAAWVGGHLTRVLAKRPIEPYVDFDIALPVAKREAVEAHVHAAGWGFDFRDTPTPTPLPHTRLFEGRPRWGVSIDLVYYAEPTVADFVQRFDLNVLRLWATLSEAVTGVPLGTLSTLTVQGREDTGEADYAALLAGDLREVPGAWVRPWRLGKYRQILGLGPIPGRVLPVIRPPTWRQTPTPPEGFEWMDRREIQDWRSTGPSRAPWVLAPLDTYSTADALYDAAVANSATWDSKLSDFDGRLQLDRALVLVASSGYATPEPGSPPLEAGLYVENGRYTLGSNGYLHVRHFPVDVWDRLMELQATT